MMSGNESRGAFVRNANQRLVELRGSLKQLVQSLAKEEKNDKVSKAQAALRSLEVLQASVANEDRPPWISPLRSTLTNYCTQPEGGHINDLAHTLGIHYGTIQAHTWAFDFPETDPLDFDGIYERYRKDSCIPELFDELIRILEEIVQCEELDSRRVIEALQAIIATFRKNREGSFFSMYFTWEFGRRYLINVAWEGFGDIPILGTPVRALRTTIDEMDKEMSRVCEGMNKEVSKRLSAEFPLLTYKPTPLPALPAPSDESSEESDDNENVQDSTKGEAEGCS